MSWWDRVKRAVVGPPPASPPMPVTSPISSAPDTPAAVFRPIERKALLTAANDVRRTGWMFFGRRDLIPPAGDPRTLLIDRGMLTQGLLTAERLAEMHTVGDQWALVAEREQMMRVLANQAGQAAVEADRAARLAEKARKRAESAARKKAHAEGVQQRRNTTIIFVGRGVSGRMNDHASDASKLTAAGLPVLNSSADLAAALSLSIPHLRWLAFHAEVTERMHYVQFEVPKRSGGTRTLSAPHKKMAAAQQWILANILDTQPVHDAAHGFVRGRSIVSNATPHAGAEVVINADLEQFFPSISFRRVRHLFARMGYSGSVSTLLALLCTECPRQKVTYAGTVYFVATGPRGLPQGACTSPAISNQIAARLDRRLAGLAKKHGLVYTRYADDITFSGRTDTLVGRVLDRFQEVVQSEGFRVNDTKTRVQRRHTRQSVTGLVVNTRPTPPRELIRRLRAMLHRAQTQGLDRINTAELEGLIAYIAMTRAELAAKFSKQWDQLKSDSK